MIEYDPISYQCIEEWLDYRVKHIQIINMFSYCKFISRHSLLANCPSSVKYDGRF